LTKDDSKRRLWPVLAPLALLALSVSLISPVGRHQWALSLFRQPTYYTVLSFNKASALPTTAIADEPLPISFDIGNYEGRAITYRYVVSETGGGKPQILQVASRMVTSGATMTVPTIVSPRYARSPCRVQVSLSGYPEKIDFLLTLKAGRKLMAHLPRISETITSNLRKKSR
jgi:hypothetical protein